VLIVRPDAPLFYANAQPLRDAVHTLTTSAREPARALVLDLDGSDELDVTSAEALAAVIADLRARHIRVGLAHLHTRAAQLLRRAGTLGAGSAFAHDDGCQVFPNLDAAVRWARPAMSGDPSGSAPGPGSGTLGSGTLGSGTPGSAVPPG
jgi:MFS superfamily sulfate permease-like transporter